MDMTEKLALIIATVSLIISVAVMAKSFLTNLKLNDMATKFSEIRQEMDLLKSTTALERAQIKQKIDAQNAKIEELEQIIRDDSGSEADKLALLNDIKTMNQEIKDIIPDTPAPGDDTGGDDTDDDDDSQVDPNL